MYRRIQYNELKSRIEEPRDKIQVLSGPRQVGKSTLVKQVIQEIDLPYMFVSADNVDPDNTGWISEMWSTARARMKAAGKAEYLLVIDEVHKVDNWSENIIHLLEVGDYVNGVEVIGFEKDNDNKEYLQCGVGDYVVCTYDEEDIKSIVTKEKFESMEYKL